MTNIIGTIYSSRNFTYLPNAKTFVGEISEVREVLRQLWNDSMDLGFGIKSHKTGRVVFFTLTGIQKNHDGEIVSWNFDIYNPKNHPDLHGLKVRILND